MARVKKGVTAHEVNIENSIRMVFAVRFFYSLGGERY